MSSMQEQYHAALTAHGTVPSWRLVSTGAGGFACCSMPRYHVRAQARLINRRSDGCKRRARLE